LSQPDIERDKGFENGGTVMARTKQLLGPRESIARENRLQRTSQMLLCFVRFGGLILDDTLGLHVEGKI